MIQTVTNESLLLLAFCSISVKVTCTFPSSYTVTGFSSDDEDIDYSWYSDHISKVSCFKWSCQSVISEIRILHCIWMLTWKTTHQAMENAQPCNFSHLKQKKKETKRYHHISLHTGCLPLLKMHTFFAMQPFKMCALPGQLHGKVVSGFPGPVCSPDRDQCEHSLQVPCLGAYCVRSRSCECQLLAVTCRCLCGHSLCYCNPMLHQVHARPLFVDAAVLPTPANHCPHHHPHRWHHQHPRRVQTLMTLSQCLNHVPGKAGHHRGPVCFAARSCRLHHHPLPPPRTWPAGNWHRSGMCPDTTPWHADVAVSALSAQSAQSAACDRCAGTESAPLLRPSPLACDHGICCGKYTAQCLPGKPEMTEIGHKYCTVLVLSLSAWKHPCIFQTSSLYLTCIPHILKPSLAEVDDWHLSWNNCFFSSEWSGPTVVVPILKSNTHGCLKWVATFSSSMKSGRDLLRKSVTTWYLTRSLQVFYPQTSLQLLAWDNWKSLRCFFM